MPIWVNAKQSLYQAAVFYGDECQAKRLRLGAFLRHVLKSVVFCKGSGYLKQHKTASGSLNLCKTRLFGHIYPT